jgi:hypothetical protein
VADILPRAGRRTPRGTGRRRPPDRPHRLDGRTAVAAKPIIQISVAAFDPLEAFRIPLERLDLLMRRTSSASAVPISTGNRVVRL